MLEDYSFWIHQQSIFRSRPLLRTYQNISKVLQLYTLLKQFLEGKAFANLHFPHIQINTSNPMVDILLKAASIILPECFTSITYVPGHRPPLNQDMNFEGSLTLGQVIQK